MYRTMDAGAITVWSVRLGVGRRRTTIASCCSVSGTHNFNSYKNIAQLNADAILYLQQAKEQGLDRSLFERIQDAYIGAGSKANVYSLREQFRMHPDICAFSNKYFYDDELETNQFAIDANFPLKPYSVFSLDYVQSNKHGNTKVYNLDEADFVINVLKTSMKYASPEQYSYGIITPYTGQRDEIGKRLR